MQLSGSNQDSGVKTILITGGCGFIGINLIKYLADSGYQIRILDNLSVSTEENLRKLQSQNSRLLTTDLIIGDIRNRDMVSQIVKGMDAVVHLAADSNVVQSLENPEDNWDINVNGTLNLLGACRENVVDKFIFASSNAAVGEQAPPIDETKVPHPLSPYGASKLAGEALCSAFHNSFGLKAISLRFSNVYGPYSNHKSSVITKFLKWAREENPFVIYGDGNQTRDFIHVDDICYAIHLALMRLDSGLETQDSLLFQIATGVETSINRLAEIIRRVANRKTEIIHELARKGEIRKNYSNIYKARMVLGFEPKIKLEDGLDKLWRLV